MFHFGRGDDPQTARRAGYPAGAGIHHVPPDRTGRIAFLEIVDQPQEIRDQPDAGIKRNPVVRA